MMFQQPQVVQAADFLGCHDMKAQIIQWFKNALLLLVQDSSEGVLHASSSPSHVRLWHFSKVWTSNIDCRKEETRGDNLHAKQGASAKMF